jgi:hypothetical protein
MIDKKLSNLLAWNTLARFRQQKGKVEIFDDIVGYQGMKRTFLRSLNSDEPVHILLVGLPGQGKILFLKSILEAFGEKSSRRQKGIVGFTSDTDEGIHIIVRVITLHMAMILFSALFSGQPPLETIQSIFFI